MRFHSKTDARRRAIAAGYRSGLEEVVAQELSSVGINFGYETVIIRYTPPLKTHKYTPDFVFVTKDPCLGCGGVGCDDCYDDGKQRIFVETKGYFKAEDRQKHLAIKAEKPHLDIRFVFTRPQNPIRKGSKTTYAKWCDAHGFPWAARSIPSKWLEGVV